MGAWVRLKRNNNGTYSIYSKLEGKVGVWKVDRGPLKYLLGKVISEREFWALVKKLHDDKAIGNEEYNYIIKEMVVEVL